MKNLEEFLRLSHYFKSYQLYLKFSEVNDRNKRAIDRIEDKLEEKPFFSLKEIEELNHYHHTLGKVDINNKILETSFNNFDFSESPVEQSMTDYKLYSFEFIVDHIIGSMGDKKFPHKKNVINHVRAAEQVIKHHFMKKFFIPDDLDKIFEKAVEHVLSSYFQWDHQDIEIFQRELVEQV